MDIEKVIGQLPFPPLVIESVNPSICPGQETKRDFWNGNEFRDVALPPEHILILTLFLRRMVGIIISGKLSTFSYVVFHHQDF